MHRGGLRHRDPALADELERLLDGHRACRGDRGELADRVADDEVRLDAARADRREHGERRGDERRLLHRGVDEVVRGAAEAQVLEIEPRCRAAAPVDVHRLGHRLGDVEPHPGLDRALAREAERNLVGAGCHQAAISFVQRIKAEPHVSPAPIPVISTSWPGRSRPSAAASASASGIDPDEVFPYRSTLITTRSDGTPSFLVAWSMIRMLAWWGM